MYKKAHTKARVKTQAEYGRDHFGSTNAATSGAFGNVRFTCNEYPGETITKDASWLEALNRYFDNLTVDATNEKSVLDKLVDNNKKLTVINKGLVIIIKKLTGENKQL